MTVNESPQTLSAEDAEAVKQVPQRVMAAWERNDADAFAEIFTEDGTLVLPGDIHLKSREEIRAFLTKAYAGPYKGTRVTGTPIGVKHLGSDITLLTTQGGVMAPGETEVSPERAIRASWLLVKQGREWLITAYQNTPIHA